MSNHYFVRPMHADDVHSVLALEQRVQSHPWSKAQFEDALQSYQCTVLEMQGRCVGFCIIQTVLDEANLLLIAIDPAWQGQGLGAKLLSESLARLPNQPIQIFLEVRQSNQAAIALYEKLAFHQIDVRKNYYPCSDGGREHAVIMVKSQAEQFADLFRHE